MAEVFLVLAPEPYSLLIILLSDRVVLDLRIDLAFRPERIRSPTKLRSRARSISATVLLRTASLPPLALELQQSPSLGLDLFEQDGSTLLSVGRERPLLALCVAIVGSKARAFDRSPGCSTCCTVAVHVQNDGGQMSHELCRELPHNRELRNCGPSLPCYTGQHSRSRTCTPLTDEPCRRTDLLYPVNN